MKKIFFILVFIIVFTLSLTGCALTEFFEDQENVVDLGDGNTFVKWNLVHNNNKYSNVESAYFEFNKDSFKYCENGELKKEGTHRITYYGLENTNEPLHLNLNFGQDSTGFSIFDYIDCYTEDSKENLHQFTIMTEGYHVEPLRQGGVPVRDYHLSDMPYAFGTYVKEGTQQYSYKNGKANYLNSSRLDGTFCDDTGNTFYFVNNSYSSDSDSSSYTVYMRYENHVNDTFVEGTISLSYYEDFWTHEHHDVALIYVTHGEWEPAEESGVYAEADYELMDFVFDGDNSFTFLEAKYFSEKIECDYNPANFIGGKYYKVN